MKNYILKIIDSKNKEEVSSFFINIDNLWEDVKLKDTRLIIEEAIKRYEQRTNL